MICESIAGFVRDPATGDIYRSTIHNLTSADALTVVQIAKKLHDIKSAVSWAQTAVDAGKKEGLGKKNLKMLVLKRRNLIKRKEISC